MKIVVPGEGAVGIKPLGAIQQIDGPEVVASVEGVPDAPRAPDEKFGTPHWSLDLGEGLSQPAVKAATSPP
jgi:hypothetical protein